MGGLGQKTLQLPTVLGHESSGTVLAVGSEVRHFKPGGRVVNDPLIFCGHCRACGSGATNMCENREIYGKRRGAFAEHSVLPERVSCPLNERLTLEEGALLENLGIAVHAVEVERHDPGEWAVIRGGGGPIGILAAQALVAGGVSTIITELSDTRIQLAWQITGALVVDAKREEPVERIMVETRGRGADFVIEMGACQAVLDQAFQVVRSCGSIVTIGTFDRPVSFNPFFALARREIRFQGVMGHTQETWRRMNQLIDSGRLQLKPLISHILPLDEYAQGFHMVKRQDAGKVLLKP